MQFSSWGRAMVSWAVMGLNPSWTRTFTANFKFIIIIIIITVIIMVLFTFREELTTFEHSVYVKFIGYNL